LGRGKWEVWLSETICVLGPEFGKDTVWGPSSKSERKSYSWSLRPEYSTLHPGGERRGGGHKEGEKESSGGGQHIAKQTFAVRSGWRAAWSLQSRRREGLHLRERRTGRARTEEEEEANKCLLSGLSRSILPASSGAKKGS